MSIAERLAAVRETIARACDAAGRDPASVTLVAVSKRHPAAAVLEAMAAGQTVFGENYAQELVEKAAAVPGARWHFIGHLQRNKARQVIGTGATIETVDSVRLVEELDRRAEGSLDVLLQVDVAREASKSGCAVEELPELVAAARAASKLRLRGLMTVPPAGEDPTRWFRALRELAQAHELPELSMGMSADLEVAIAEGATIVRVGTAIFGPRPS
ncbi:MAG: YggS family pyridoxal phosphate-dependent enzyme [Sandaracinaceae bacterium]|nr:YggS family pyridoxal phosphate-dependent enzyme [Sandaracinaceae bacterium]